MRQEVETLQQLMRNGKITHSDAVGLLKAMEEADEKEAWESGEFELTSFIASSDTLHRTLLDDMISAELDRAKLEVLETLSLPPSHPERKELLEKLEATPISRFETLEQGSLLWKLRKLREFKGVELFWAVNQLKTMEEFQDSVDLQNWAYEFLVSKSPFLETLVSAQSAAREILHESQAGETVVLHNSFPADIEMEGTEEKELKVQVTKRAWAESCSEAEAQAEKIDVAILREGDRIWVLDERLPDLQAGRTQLFFKLSLPKGVNARIFNASGNVRTKNTMGELSVSTFVGKVEVEHGSGDLHITTRRGDITIRDWKGAEARTSSSIKIESITGDVGLINCYGDVQIKSPAGQIDLKKVAGLLEARSIIGDIFLRDICTRDLKLSTADGKIDFEGTVLPGGGRTVHTRAGDIRVALTRHTDCGLSARSERGTVACSLSTLRAGEQTEHLVWGNVRRGSGLMEIQSVSGNINIVESSENET